MIYGKFATMYQTCHLNGDGQHLIEMKGANRHRKAAVAAEPLDYFAKSLAG
jgi:hypothetical protein